ncbi:hypothetical protein BsWGS_04447 [Bradybaena similaris]
MAAATENINITESQFWANGSVDIETGIHSNCGNPDGDDDVEHHDHEADEHAAEDEDAVEKESPEMENDDKSLSSSASEIANLADVTVSEDTIDEEGSDGASDTNVGLTDKVTRAIEAATFFKSTSIDLSKSKLRTFPEALSNLPQLEYMYLEGNEITTLPGEFFKMFPNLRWLDLRNNLLTRMPSAYLSTHSCLRNLLLEGNSLRTLPLELGLVKSLHGLNLAGNHLDFPPPEIIEHGTQYILLYLRDLYEAKCSQQADLELKLSEEAPLGCEHKSEVSDDWNTTASLMDLAKRREKMFQAVSHGNADISQMQDSVNETYGNLCKSPKGFSEMKFKKSGADMLIGKKKKMNILSWKMNPYPSLPSSDYVKFKMNEDKHLAKVREQKRKIEAIIQNQKNEAVLKKWREVAKILQQKKYSQRLLPGKDYKEPAEQAPFGIEMEMMKMLSKEDRLKADLERDLELKRQRIVSPRTRASREQDRENNIIELEEKVKKHMALMVERRTKPKGTPQQEKEVARRELEIAEQLYSELFAQRRDIEYHIKTVSTGAARAIKANKPKAT